MLSQHMEAPETPPLSPTSFVRLARGSVPDSVRRWDKDQPGPSCSRNSASKQGDLEPFTPGNCSAGLQYVGHYIGNVGEGCSTRPTCQRGHTYCLHRVFMQHCVLGGMGMCPSNTARGTISDMIDTECLSEVATSGDTTPNRMRDFISLSPIPDRPRPVSFWAQMCGSCAPRTSLKGWVIEKLRKILALLTPEEELDIYANIPAQDLKMVLDNNKKFLHDYILKTMPQEIIEKLFNQKVEMGKDLVEENSKHTYAMAELWRIEKNNLKRIVQKLTDASDMEFVAELAKNVAKMVHSNNYRILEVRDGMELGCMEVSTYEGHNLPHLMSIPIMKENGEGSHVIEIWRAQKCTLKDVEVASSLMTWGSIALQYCKRMKKKNQQKELTDFLMGTVRAIFEEMVSLDKVIKRILQFAQKLVDADRASLFLVDHENAELVSTVFDQQLDGQEPGEKKEIRMPIHKGIAGHVVSTGQLINIPKAYLDGRFNRTVDEATGYRTNSILCMPVKVQGEIIGVVQMVNKRNAEWFCIDDENSFNVFATFFGLVLHHARLYDKIKRNEQQYKVALEVLSYHNTCRRSDANKLAFLGLDLPYALDNFYLDPFALTVVEKCQAIMIMFDDLFGLRNFESLNVQMFVLTVKKNYREVPYHNFHHGWSVAQTMYAILKTDTAHHFSPKQRLALFVASLCHDLDHRGYTNKYMSETASPLAAMYTTSTLEHHHFNTTVTILQQDGHNIFSRYSAEEYREILKLIKVCILATDLMAFFPNLAELKLLFSPVLTYDWENPRHRELAMAITMTAADLSASAKPWDVQNKTVKVIFEEFYEQGDKEREAGREPILMMDRNKKEEQAASQVGFFEQICQPCYEMLNNILPGTLALLEKTCENHEMWTQKAAEIAQRKMDEEIDLEGIDLE